MNGFMVVYRTGMDDIPLMLTDTPIKAGEYAKQIFNHYKAEQYLHADDEDIDEHDDVSAAYAKLSMDVQTFMSICVYEFVNGVLDSMTVVCTEEDL